MGALTLRQPDENYRRPKERSERRKMCVNCLIDEMATRMLAEFDAESRFRLRAERGHGKPERRIELLDKAGGPGTRKG